MQINFQDPEFRKLLEELVSQAVARFVAENELKAREISLVKRLIRVEEELKALREIMFEYMKMTDKRFELMEEANRKRFEAIEKRLSFLQWFMGFGFTFIASLIGIATYLLAC
ncbi:hypothetical protein [Thermosulfurimonas sp. F29]|uniref:hypothetical protein n=1 Tax=Thermosulfurimonas sp. F29 TaxID=2867247 RepID=UPI001C82EA25|nr:hypothetical protein [Thermosulfurimonas sp. F29]MBX6422817.1 hypothetical protein [Thermosulfurimonas sp. F29]